MIEQTYLSNPECGLRLSNYHQETDSLLNEAISPHSRNLTLPGVLPSHRISSPPVVSHSNPTGAQAYSTIRVRHSPGRITRIPVGPGSLDLPMDFFERRAPDGTDSGPEGGAAVPRRKEEKKLSFADQVSVRSRDRNFDNSQVRLCPSRLRFV